LAIRDFNIVIPGKIRAPNNSENATGAISRMAQSIFRMDLESMNVSNQYLQMEELEQKKKIVSTMDLD
jgi:predicted phosphoribosyltransferase